MKWDLHSPGFTLRSRLLQWRTLTWMKKLHGCHHDNIFCQGSSSKVKFLGQFSNPPTRNLPSKEIQLEDLIYLYQIVLSSFPTCQLLSKPVPSLLYFFLNIYVDHPLSPMSRSMYNLLCNKPNKVQQYVSRSNPCTRSLQAYIFQAIDLHH